MLLFVPVLIPSKHWLKYDDPATAKAHMGNQGASDTAPSVPTNRAGVPTGGNICNIRLRACQMVLRNIPNNPNPFCVCSPKTACRIKLHTKTAGLYTELSFATCRSRKANDGGGQQCFAQPEQGRRKFWAVGTVGEMLGLQRQAVAFVNFHAQATELARLHIVGGIGRHAWFGGHHFQRDPVRPGSPDFQATPDGLKRDAAPSCALLPDRPRN